MDSEHRPCASCPIPEASNLASKNAADESRIQRRTLPKTGNEHAQGVVGSARPPELPVMYIASGNASVKSIVLVEVHLTGKSEMKSPK